MKDNIYGLQPVEAQYVRSKKDIALSTTGAMAQGAQMGSKYGIVGTAVGAGLGAGLGYLANKEAKKEELSQRKFDESYNRFVEGMAGRSSRSQEVVGPQARSGMRSKRYQMAEIEGKNGVGEIHTDKNFNVKNLANNSPTHENGGKKVMVEKGDVVFPTQGDPAAYKRILSDIKRYKLGDKRAGQRLERIRKSLPTDEDYGYYDNGTGDANPDGITIRESSTPNLEVLASLLGLDPTNVKNFVVNNQAAIKEANTKGDFSNVQKLAKSYGIEPDVFLDFIDNAIGGGKNITGSRTGDYSGLGKNTVSQLPLLAERYKKEEEELKNNPNSVHNTKGGLVFTPPTSNTQTNTQPVTTTNKPVTTTQPVTTNKTQVVASNQTAPPNVQATQTQTAATQGANPNTTSSGGVITTTQPTTPTTTTTDDVEEEQVRNVYKTYENPLKRANILHNFAMGAQPEEKVVRRTYTPEEYKYRDLSEAARQSNIENRNTMLRYRQNLTNRAGAIGVMGQIASRYNSQAEAINEREAQRHDQTIQQNVGLRNQAKEINLNLANQYDDLDARNRAARQSYTDAGYSETSKLAQVDENRRYMMNRDAKLDNMDAKALKYIGSKYYEYDKNGNLVFKRVKGK